MEANLKILLLAAFILGGDCAAASQKKQEPVNRILFIFDASQSMLGRWQSGRKIDIARKLLNNMLDSLKDMENLEIGLRVYGHQKSYPPQDCNDTKLEVTNQIEECQSVMDAKLSKQKLENGWSFPYLLDIDQTLAKALKAACTPDFFLFSCDEDGIQKLRYRGQLDGSRPGINLPVNGEDLRAALDAVLEDKGVCPEQKPSIGCNIKWHPGQEPSWFG